MTSLLAAALKYAVVERLPVFPCQPRGKEPAIKRGFYAATTNPQTIKRYWRIADRNIGIPTGSVSGVWIFDVDGEDGEATLRRLEDQHGALPPTREVITRRGRHLWFKYTGPIPSTAGKVGAGLDTRGDGGYVVAPPSVHASGALYAWNDSANQLAVAPDWLVRLARARPQSISERALASIRRPSCQPDAYGRVALDREIEMLAGTPAGGRNHALNRCSFRLAQLVAGGELDRDQVIDRLVHASHRNGLINDDGLKSVRATIASGMDAGFRHPRSRGAS